MLPSSKTTADGTTYLATLDQSEPFVKRSSLRCLVRTLGGRLQFYLLINESERGREGERERGREGERERGREGERERTSHQFAINVSKKSYFIICV